MPFEETMPHGQCARCKKMVYGSQAGAEPGREILYVDDETGQLFGAGEMPGNPLDYGNVSHTMCPECQAAFLEESRQSRERRRGEREDSSP